MQLSSWPVPAIAAAAILCGLIAMALIGLLAARFSPWREHPDGQVAALDTAKLVGGLLGLFLIFLLSQGMTYFREAEVATAREAGNLLQLDRALAGTAPGDADPARRLLHGYVSSVVQQEWPEMRRHSRGSEDTELALTRLGEGVAAILARDPAAAALHNLQKNLDDIEDDRTARIGRAESGLPAALWQTVAVLFTLFAIALFLLDPAARPFRVLSLYTAGLFLLVALLFMADGAYRGEFSVGPAPLQRALTRMLSP